MKLFYCFFSLLFLFISGCASQRSPSISLPAVPSSLGCQMRYQSDNLRKSGVQVIKVGDELRLILPNSRFFVKNTATLQVSSYPVLNEIVALLNQTKNLGINVLAYTPSLEDFTPNTSLAQQQAQVVVNYFLQQGLNTRLILASAWKGTSDRQKQGTGSFSDDSPGIFSVEIRTRLLQPEDSQ
ncbi:MAG: OmpA family protein [Pseudomonadota bacterium]